MTRQKATTSSQLVSILALHAKAAFVKESRRIKVINTHGTQIVDCWALKPYKLGEYMSLEHCRVSIERVCPRKSDVMVTNRRRSILKIMEDSAPGPHRGHISNPLQSAFARG